jgi:hypothetical protein
MIGEQGKSAVDTRRASSVATKGVAVVLYIILAVLFVAGLLAYVKVRGRRLSGR